MYKAAGSLCEIFLAKLRLDGKAAPDNCFNSFHSVFVRLSTVWRAHLRPPSHLLFTKYSKTPLGKVVRSSHFESYSVLRCSSTLWFKVLDPGFDKVAHHIRVSDPAMMPA